MLYFTAVLRWHTWFSLMSRWRSLHTSLYAAASCSYSISLKSIPGKTSLTRASNLEPSVNVSFDNVLILKACTTSFASSSLSTLAVSTKEGRLLQVHVSTFSLFPVQFEQLYWLYCYDNLQNSRASCNNHWYWVLWRCRNKWILDQPGHLELMAEAEFSPLHVTMQSCLLNIFQYKNQVTYCNYDQLRSKWAHCKFPTNKNSQCYNWNYLLMYWKFLIMLIQH